jgi:hypothetical protein
MFSQVIDSTKLGTVVTYVSGFVLKSLVLDTCITGTGTFKNVVNSCYVVCTLYILYLYLYL